MGYAFRLGSIELSIPSGLHELSLGAFISLYNLNDKADVVSTLSILSGIDKKIWDQADLSAVNIEMLNTALAWTNKKQDLNGMPLPEKVTINGKEVSIPKNVALKTFGQKIAFDKMVLKNISLKGEETLVNPPLMPMALAIYLQPEYTGEKFDSDGLIEFAKLCEMIPVSEALPIVAFFLSKLLNLRSVKVKSNTPKMRTTKGPERKILPPSET